MLLKVAHHGARIMTLATGLGLMGVLLVPRLTGDASVTLASLHVRGRAPARRRRRRRRAGRRRPAGRHISSPRRPPARPRPQPFLMVFAFAVLSSLGVTSYVADYGGRVSARAGRQPPPPAQATLLAQACKQVDYEPCSRKRASLPPLAVDLSAAVARALSPRAAEPAVSEPRLAAPAARHAAAGVGGGGAARLPHPLRRHAALHGRAGLRCAPAAGQRPPVGQGARLPRLLGARRHVAARLYRCGAPLRALPAPTSTRVRPPTSAPPPAPRQASTSSSSARARM